MMKSITLSLALISLPALADHHQSSELWTGIHAYLAEQVEEAGIPGLTDSGKLAKDVAAIVLAD